ncbi:LytR/AlgR family response regulator transcription factor [Polaribacter porphyrae]|uniref:DNA-binding response regulator n=1 Tax=Polaribacter porphyrae TaxID=1137780 RepID=A0A2S7WNA1_9FLAO|nr:LytTR family DNA-binding domain-containing protein [Polaribacter porphyrae]PQJ79085.1 hypothetical protein BTO18_07835 [Polaribacter porphyrae]
MELKILIVEDEINSQELLKNLLIENCESITITGVCESVKKAIQLINENKPDLVFLDIELQDGSGFKVLNNFDEQHFYTVLVTGYDNYGIEAVKKSVLDYILKPYAVEEIINIVDKTRKKIDFLKPLKILKNNNKVNLKNDKITIKTSKKTTTILLEEIVIIEAFDPYTKLLLTEDRILISELRLKDMILILPNFFNQIHRSYIINLNFVKEWDRGRGGKVFMKNGDIIPISYRNKKEFIKQFSLFKSF